MGSFTLRSEGISIEVCIRFKVFVDRIKKTLLLGKFGISDIKNADKYDETSLFILNNGRGVLLLMLFLIRSLQTFLERKAEFLLC